jgi:hypothetical protein
MNAPKLEDFSSPQERLREYQLQCRGLPRLKKARFWLGVLEADPAVAKLCKANGTPRKGRRSRSSKWDDVPLHREVGQVEENGVSQ